MSADGRYVAFRSSAKNLRPEGGGGAAQVYVRDLVEKTTTLASVRDGETPQGDGFSSSGHLSPDGRHLAFEVSAPGTRTDIFVRDLDARTTRPVTVSPTGGPLNGDSWDPRFGPDGNHLSFNSRASNLVADDTNGVQDVFVRLNVL